MPLTSSSSHDRLALDAARAAFLDRVYRGKSVLFVGVGDGAALEVAASRGAHKVAGIDIDEQAVKAAQARLGERAQLKAGPVREAGSLGGPFDVVMVRRGETMVARDLWREVSKLVRPGGWLVAAALAGDRDGAPRGAMAYARLVEHLSAYFPHVTMLAQSVFAGAALIPFGGGEVDPVLDVALADAPVPELYVGLAGPEPLTLPYGLVELPSRDGGDEAAARPAQSAPTVAPAPDKHDKPDKADKADKPDRPDKSAERTAALEAMVRERDTRLRTLEEAHRALTEEKRALSDRNRALTDEKRALADDKRALVEEMERRERGSAMGELRERLLQSEQALEAARTAALSHAEAMRAAQTVIGERDAYVEELERDLRGLDETQKKAQAATVRADEAEARERASRRKVAELQGTVLRLRGELGLPPQAEGTPETPAEVAPSAEPPRVVELAAPSAADEEAAAQLAALQKRVAELEAHNQKLLAKAADSEREAWAHLKARSEAEAAAAEVREDTVRKLKDARKIANVELMRAMEEATRKAVMLKEELVRSERERKEAVAQAAELQAELSRQREAAEERLQRAASEEAARVLASLEARVIGAEGERDAAVARLRELERGGGAGGVGGGEAAGGAAAAVGADAVSALSATAQEVEEMLVDIERSLRTETARVGRIEQSLVAALAELRRVEAAGVGSGEVGGGGEGV